MCFNYGVFGVYKHQTHPKRSLCFRHLILWRCYSTQMPGLAWKLPIAHSHEEHHRIPGWMWMKIFMCSWLCLGKNYGPLTRCLQVPMYASCPCPLCALQLQLPEIRPHAAAADGSARSVVAIKVIGLHSNVRCSVLDGTLHATWSKYVCSLPCGASNMCSKECWKLWHARWDLRKAVQWGHEGGCR